MQLNKNIIRDLTYYGYDTSSIIKPEMGERFRSIIIISKGRHELHDSGYPFIIALGVEEHGKRLYDMGQHDHIWFPDKGKTVNFESLGQNIFNFWTHDTLVARYGSLNLSTLTIDCADGVIS